MSKMDKLDRIIRDYINKKFDARILAIESRIMNKPKVDNLGIRTAYSGGAEQVTHVLNKEELENNEERQELIKIRGILDFFWEPLVEEQRKVIELRCRGLGLYWYQVENEMYDIYGSENRIGIKKAKAIYQEFKEDIEPHI